MELFEAVAGIERCAAELAAARMQASDMDRLEVLHLDDVMTARVGDVVATLRRSGRQHALVVDTAEGTAPVICGMFSLTQIGRRLGIPPQQVHDIARTFAEIEALIASH